MAESLVDYQGSEQCEAKVLHAPRKVRERHLQQSGTRGFAVDSAMCLLGDQGTAMEADCLIGMNLTHGFRGGIQHGRRLDHGLECPTHPIRTRQTAEADDCWFG